ncbi:Protein YLS3 Protein YELLOW-LEAF-SPECIFIC GENE 3 Xylogen-like protein [Vigna angularis]|uniref:Protein YLS3 Protein YELLOW-LEAF-SPECIFIC GENE 3 Xylogen-like protein n=1 Tax=Phaseolus angularis TaxID=3914 RepID=A0A8T0JZU4_PHAAN|nr:Protein YLS3 Protein YELLOW-LEAF-SPECIFIC GENE 3 Xylogen-like protein [Vigna angularis]
MLVLAMILVLVMHAMGDSAQEIQKCVETLSGVATCLPYLGGEAKAPTADCCSGIRQAMKSNKKCICVILKDRDDPDLGFKINITITVGLFSLCKAPDNLSQCSALLHLDPNSPEAQAFNEKGVNSNGDSASPSPSPSAKVSSENGRNQGTDETVTAKNGGSYEGKRLLEIFVATAVAGLILNIHYSKAISVSVDKIVVVSFNSFKRSLAEMANEGGKLETEVVKRMSSPYDLSVSDNLRDVITHLKGEKYENGLTNFL